MAPNFKKFNSIGEEEIKEVLEVLESGELSKFYGEWSEQFYGGRKVQKFERDLADFFEVKYAITFNSWTSGLVASIGAIGIEPGDEVIVSPWTMSATAMAILHWNAIPIFVDIDVETYCINPSKIKEKITPRTKAILAVDIFGQSSNSELIMEIASENGLKVISDSAQSPGAMRHGKFAGTSTHFGGISLNYHKHIHTGEGGVLFTNDDELAFRACLIRNHAESVVAGAGVSNLSNMIGHNFRMTELEAAVGIAQLRKLPKIAKERSWQGAYLSDGLSGLPGLQVPKIDSGNTHVFYTFPMQIDIELIQNSKWKVINELTDRGIPGLSGSYPLLHLLPLFQEKIAYGNSHFPWSLNDEQMQISYAKGICPVAESLIDDSFIQFYMNDFDLNQEALDFIVQVFHEQWTRYI